MASEAGGGGRGRRAWGVFGAVLLAIVCTSGVVYSLYRLVLLRGKTTGEIR